MNINELIKEAHGNAVEKGFYDCPKCKGSGLYYEKYPDCKNCAPVNECRKSYGEYCCISSVCDFCKGTGINQNKNIPELLMLVVTEISEAVESLREKRFAELNKNVGFIGKDTFEDEIADTFIRLADICGYLKIDIEKHILAKIKYNSTRPKKHGKEF